MVTSSHPSGNPIYLGDGFDRYGIGLAHKTTKMIVSMLMILTLLWVTDCLNIPTGPIRPRDIISINDISKGVLVGASVVLSASTPSRAQQFEYQPALQGLDYGKPRTSYPDFTQTRSGLQYKIVKTGDGIMPSTGDRVVLDWEGYTIGYYGRPFQARNKVKGGAYSAKKGERDDEYFRFILGSGAAIAAVDEAVRYLKEGAVAQIIVPAELGYPVKGDQEHEIVGPKPTTFSGKQALNFVLDNQNLIDKTLLINVRYVPKFPFSPGQNHFCTLISILRTFCMNN